MLSLRSLLLFGLFNFAYAKHDLAHRSPNSHRFTVAESSFNKAQLGRRSTFTWFVTGVGACGGTNVPSDFIVALPALDWDNGAHCFETITITINGISTQAQIVDECMNCASGDLDFTTGLYSFFDPDTSHGVLEGSWEYGTGSDSGNSGADENTTRRRRRSLRLRRPLRVYATRHERYAYFDLHFVLCPEQCSAFFIFSAFFVQSPTLLQRVFVCTVDHSNAYSFRWNCAAR
ncbi:hypothetical protein CPB85DRAFT_1562795 [Mucidula mucida]|nr:hypothetical protein CPB85DRAFT_1562795 [Mucidula mucida]